MEGDGNHDFYAPNFQNSQSFPLQSPSWYTPAPAFSPQENFEFYPNFDNNNNNTSIPSNAFYDSSSSSSNGAIIPSFPMDQNLNVNNPFLGEGQHTSMEELNNHPSTYFTNEANNSFVEILDGSHKGFTKRLWTIEEDRKLRELVDQLGTKSWSKISESMIGRDGKQCRERWFNNLRPDIKGDDWTEEEEIILIEAHKQMGTKWSKIVQFLPGRTENSIKNHWNSALRKKTERKYKINKDEPDKLKSTILRDYIQGKSSTSINNTTNTNSIYNSINVSLPINTPNIVAGNLYVNPMNDPMSSFYNYSPSINNFIPSFDNESDFFQNMFPTSTMVLQPETPANYIGPVLQPLESQSQITTSINQQGFINGDYEYGSLANLSMPIYDTTFSSNYDDHLSYHMGETATLSNYVDPIYGYGYMMNSDLPLNYQGGGF